MKSWKTSVLLGAALLCSPFHAPGQQPSTLPVSDPIGRFLGTWELHMKEGPAIPDRDSLTIERTEGGIKITHLSAVDHGTSILHYWGVMDPKGSFVLMHEMDGKPMNEEWRIVSVDKEGLIIETRPFGGKKKYQLSADGQIMKMSRLPGTVKFPVSLPDLTYTKSK